MTKREMFNEIINLAEENERKDIADFATKEIDLIDKRASKKNEDKKAKKEENEGLASNILSILANNKEAIRTKDIAEALGISTQKTTPILKALTQESKINRIEEKRVIYYTLPNNIDTENEIEEDDLDMDEIEEDDLDIDDMDEIEEDDLDMDEIEEDKE